MLPHSINPGGKTQQHQPTASNHNEIRATLDRRNPQKPHAGRKQREGQSLFQHTHPGPRLRHPGRQPRNARHQNIRRGQAKPHRQEHEKPHQRRSAQSPCNGNPHEWSGTRCCNNHSQKARQHITRMTCAMRMQLRQTPCTDFKNAQQIERHAEQQPANTHHKPGRLELETPPGRRPRNAQPDHDDSKSSKRPRYAQRVKESTLKMHTTPYSAHSGQRQGFHGQNREDTGHEVQDQATDESKSQNP